MKISRTRNLFIGICLAFLFASSAQALPDCQGRVIKLIAPNPAGAAGDIISRIIAEEAGSSLGQSVIVENRSGATSIIGTAYAAKSRPDGCTILNLTASGVVVSVLKHNLPYDLMKDFRPIISIGSVPMALAVPIAAKINSIDDLAKLAKSERGLNYASGGVGTLAHLSSVRLIKDLKGMGNHVPFRGNPEAAQALLGNHVQMFFLSAADVPSLIESGKAKVLAVTSKERMSTLPKVPTMIELGFKDFSPTLWYGFLAPVKTPEKSIQQLYKAILTTINNPKVKSRLTEMGFSIETKDPDNFSKYMKEETVSWRKVIRENNIK